jgi:hypothetical protein
MTVCARRGVREACEADSATGKQVLAIKRADEYVANARFASHTALIDEGIARAQAVRGLRGLPALN